MNPKWIKDLNVRPKTMTLLHENIGQKLHDIAFGNDFLDRTQKVTREKTDKWISWKFLSFAHQRHYKKSKKRAYGMEENICKLSDERLISRI